MEFSIYLLRAGVGHDVAVRTENDTLVEVSDAGAAYIFPSSERLPNWVDDLTRLWPGIDPALLSSSRAGCILAVIAAGRTFLLAFGVGHLKVDKRLVVADFGRRVAINAVAPETVKQLTRQALEGNFIHAIESAARSGSVRQFGIDIERDLLQGLLGRPRKSAFGVAIGGATSLRVSIVGGLPSLIARLPIYLRLYQQKIRSREFDWYERIQIVQDPAEIERLDAALDAEIITPAGSPVLIGIPALLEGVDQIVGFQFESGMRANIYPDPEFTDWVAWCRTKGILPSLATAERRKIFVNFSSGTQISAPVADSIFWEHPGGNGESYVRHDGYWFKIDATFVGQVQAFMKGLAPITNVALPSYVAGVDEATYNANLATSIAGSVLLDTKTVTVPGSGSSLEPCDVYRFDPITSKGTLFFVTCPR